MHYVNWNVNYLRRLRPEIQHGLLELPIAIQKRLMERLRGFCATRCLYNFPADPNSIYYEEGSFTEAKQLNIPVMYPASSNFGLWAGEGILQGYITFVRAPLVGKNCRIWLPHLIKRHFYSEILKKKLIITCTYTLLDLVDECFGFDFYILKTPEYELRSKLGMDLKRLMLLELLKPSTDSKLVEKYSKYIMKFEDARFVGLSIAECIDLDRKIKFAYALSDQDCENNRINSFKE